MCGLGVNFTGLWPLLVSIYSDVCGMDYANEVVWIYGNGMRLCGIEVWELCCVELKYGNED